MTAPFATLGSILEDLAGLPERFTALERQLRDGRQPEKRLLRVRDVSELTSLSEDVVRRLIDEGVLASREIPGVRATVVALVDLDEFVAQLPRRPGQ